MPMNHRLLRPRSPARDPFGASVRLLLHFDNSVVDASRYGVTFTTPTGFFTGGKFGAAAYGTNQGSLVSTSQAIPDISTVDWTVEAWVYRPTGSFALANVVCLSASPDLGDFSGGLNLYINDNGTVECNNGLESSLLGGSVPLQQWRHLAVVRTGNTSTLYVNGIAVSSDGQLPEAGPYFAAVGHIPGVGFTSDLVVDEVRVTVGVARYTAAFTPPTSAFPKP